MPTSAIPSGRLLAELLRIQHWAGGDAVAADRLFGLMHGFESVIREERDSYGISEQVQRKVEDLLEDVESGTLPTDGLSIKNRLRADNIDESDAALVMQLCRLQSRFTDSVDKLVNESGSPFSHLARSSLRESDWLGALHYMELVDCSEEANKKLHAVYAPSVPRVGELVTPECGSPMTVIAVDHVVITQRNPEGSPQHFLVPHVLLTANEAVT